ncbi:hypothetical protein RKD49_005893 [Streptomyces glaucescens]
MGVGGGVASPAGAVGGCGGVASSCSAVSCSVPGVCGASVPAGWSAWSGAPGGGSCGSWAVSPAPAPMSPTSSASWWTRMPCRNAVSPTSAHVLPYTESRLPPSGTTSTERRPVRASLVRTAASRAACGVRTATRGRSRVRANSAASWSATTLPPSRVTIRSAVRAASLGSAVVTRTVPPCAAWARSMPYSHRPSRAESPSAGSSRTRVCGSASRAQARPRRRSTPRESVPRRSSRRLTRPTASRTSSARLTGTPAAAHSIRRWPRTVRPGWPGTSPRRTPTSRDGWAMRCSGRPLKWVTPRPCWSSSMSRSTVVLPAPVAPSSVVTRPARASKETSSTAGGRSLRGSLVSPKAWIT